MGDFQFAGFFWSTPCARLFFFAFIFASVHEFLGLFHHSPPPLVVRPLTNSTAKGVTGNPFNVTEIIDPIIKIVVESSEFSWPNHVTCCHVTVQGYIELFADELGVRNMGCFPRMIERVCIG